MGEDDLRKKIAELEETVETLKKDLIHDAHTGLKTKAFFMIEAGKYFNLVAKNYNQKRREALGPKNLCLIFFDIDLFKQVNDTHGHLVGDSVIKTVAGVVLKKVRGVDIAARWGGDEIVVALIGATEFDAKRKAEDIRTGVSELKFKDLNLHLTLSAGVALAVPGASFEEIVSHADQALYKAKHTGSDKIAVYSEI